MTPFKNKEKEKEKKWAILVYVHFTVHTRVRRMLFWAGWNVAEMLVMSPLIRSQYRITNWLAVYPKYTSYLYTYLPIKSENKGQNWIWGRLTEVGAVCLVLNRDANTKRDGEQPSADSSVVGNGQNKTVNS